MEQYHDFVTKHLTCVRQELSWKAVGLAGGTKKRAAFTLETANDPSAVVGAGLTFFTVHEMALLILTFQAIRGKEIFDT